MAQQLSQLLPLLLVLVQLFQFHAAFASPTSPSPSPCPLSHLYFNVSQVSVVAETEAHLAVLRRMLPHPCHIHMLDPEEPTLHARHDLEISHAFLRRYVVPSFAPRLVTVTLRDFGPLLAAAPAQHSTPADPFYSRYYTLPVLRARWRAIASRHARHAELRQYGTSIEGRPLLALVLQSGLSCQGPRVSVLVSALQHAREWATTAAATFVAEHYAANARSIPPCTTLAVVPVSNPDGYAYTATADRLWRKNRRPGTPCAGVDLNRNWDINYGGAFSTSRRTCSNEFIGAAAFSEPETAAMRDLFFALPPVVAHVDVHSFGQDLLGAYQFSPNDVAHAPVLDAVADLVLTATGANYSYSRGSASTVLYPASGFFSDWSFKQGALSYTMEVSPQHGTYVSGFFPDEKFIMPIARDVLAAIAVLLRYAHIVQPAGNLSTLPTSADPAIIAALQRPTPRDYRRAVAPAPTPHTLHTSHASSALFVIFAIALFAAVLRAARTRLFRKPGRDLESTALLA